MLAVVIIVYVFLIFPIFLNINVKYSKNEKLLEYKIKMFNFITILFGNIELIDEGIAIHINNKKAILIFYKDIFSMRKKFKPLKDYHIFKFNTSISIGINENEMQTLNFIFLYNYIFNIVGQITNQIKPYLTLKSKINLFNKEDFLILLLKTTFVFNIFMVLISLIKIILEKIVYAIKTKSQPN